MIGEPVPNAERAEVAVEKLRDYALDPQHREGVHKARVFLSALGITRDDWGYLRDQLLTGVRTAPVLRERAGEWGVRRAVRIEVIGRNGRTAPVTTGWFTPRDGEVPRLVSAYVDMAAGRAGR